MAYRPDNRPVSSANDDDTNTSLRHRLVHQEQHDDDDDDDGRNNRRLLQGDPQEILALDALYDSLQMEGTTNNWHDENIDSICDYTGIECKNDGRVSVLDLTSFGLMGTIPTEIGNLSELQRIGLGNNDLHGSLPLTLQTLTKLQHFEVFRNNLTGPILQDWTMMSKLKRLLIQSNHITGTIDSSLCTLNDLKGLDLFDNPLSGSLPSCLGTINNNNGNNSNNYKLSNLRIHGTLLTGSIPNALCDMPVVNGLSPNTFGCDAIACPVGTFLTPDGRQTQVEESCQPCLTATTIGSTTCPLTFPPTAVKPSANPSAMPTSHEPTSLPSTPRTETPSMVPSRIPTDHPTRLPTATPSWMPSLAPSLHPTPPFQPNLYPPFDEESPSTFSPETGWITGAPSTTRITFDPVATGVPSILAPTLTPQQESSPAGDSNNSNNDIRMATSPAHRPANWTLLIIACILSFLAMATVVLARRMGRKWWYAKHRGVMSADMSTSSDDDVSMESDSGWNDTESSTSSYHWADMEDHVAHEEEEESIEPWSVSLPATASASTASGSISHERY